MTNPTLYPKSAVELNETLLFEDIAIVHEGMDEYQETWVPSLKVLAKVVPILPSYNQETWCAEQHILPRRYHVFLRGEHTLRKNMRLSWRDSIFKLVTSPIHLDYFRWISFIMEEV